MPGILLSLLIVRLIKQLGNELGVKLKVAITLPECSADLQSVFFISAILQLYLSQKNDASTSRISQAINIASHVLRTVPYALKASKAGFL